MLLVLIAIIKLIFRKENEKMITNKLSNKVEQVIIGSLLGDGYLNKSKGIRTNPRFIEGHSIKQKDYLLWKKGILSQTFCMKDYSQNICDKRNQKNYHKIFIYSNTSPLLMEYYNSFYPFGKKIFSIKMLNKLQPLGLTIWYMDDGHFCKNGCSSEIAFNTESINPEILKEWFKKTFNIIGRIREERVGKGVRILFKKEETKKLFRIIQQFIHPTMRYKIRITKEDILIIKRKRRDYNQRPEVKKRRREYEKEYCQRPGMEEKRREYFKKYNPKYYLKNEKKIKEGYQKNRDNPEFKEKRKKRGKKYRKENKEEISRKQKERYQKNKNNPKFKEKANIRSKKYYQENKDNPIYKEKKRAYSEKLENKEKARARDKKRYAENKEELRRKGREYYQKNKEQVKEYNKERKINEKKFFNQKRKNLR